MDLKMIAERLRGNVYKSLKELDHDLNSMCKNAKRYNEPGSLIYKVTVKLFSQLYIQLGWIFNNKLGRKFPQTVCHSKTC